MSLKALEVERLSPALMNGVGVMEFETAHEKPGPLPESFAPADDFESLRRFALEFNARERKLYTSNANLSAAFQDALVQVEVVSFDIFDTALIRHVDHPVDVFFHLAGHAAFRAHAFSGSLAQLRLQAEQTARELVFRHIASHEVNLLEIYQVFCDLNGIAREFAEGFMEAEEQIEMELCLACAPVQALAQAAGEAGRKVIFTSDTYHRVDFLVRLLNGIGYCVDESVVFASSAYRKSKQDGGLFAPVLATLGVSPEKMLHVGDHPVSDDKQARAQGIRTILHAHKASAETPRLLQAGSRSMAGDLALSQRSLLRGLIRAGGQAAQARGHGGDFWWKFGYSSVGPLTTGFCEWLEQSLRADGMEHAYFLLRDGELLHNVYELLFAGKPDACPASTLDSSRRAMLLPIIQLAPGFVVPSLLGGIGERPVREFLERLNIPASGFEEEARRAGFRSLGQRIDGRFETDKLIGFLRQKRVLEAILARGRVELQGLVAYLEHKQVMSKKQVALVDLGWNGTIHKSLHVLMQQVSPQTHLTGYYMATFPETPHSILPGVNVRSYLAHRGQPVSAYQGIMSFLNLFETVYTSAGGSVLHFHKGATGIVSAVRQATDKSPEQSRHLQAMHAGALAFAEDYGRHTADRSYPPLPADAASEEIFRVIQQPTAEEAKKLGGLVHCDNLGSTSTHVSVELPPSADPAEMLAAYEQIHWKQGALSQPTPEAARLRTLLWLLEMQPAE